MKRIFHITTRQQDELARLAGEYAPEAFEEEGFIHCSYLAQVLDVANLRFAHQAGLVLFEIAASRLDCAVVEENLEGGEELYPHIYGQLPMSAVIAVHEFPCDGEGNFEFPEALRGIG